MTRRLIPKPAVGARRSRRAARTAAAHRLLQHLLGLAHDRLDELLLNLDQQPRQVDPRTRHVVSAQLVPRVRRLSGVDAGPERELAAERDHQRQPGDHHQQRDASIAPSPRDSMPRVFHRYPTLSVMWMRASVA